MGWIYRSKYRRRRAESSTADEKEEEEEEEEENKENEETEKDQRTKESIKVPERTKQEGTMSEREPQSLTTECSRGDDLDLTIPLPPSEQGEEVNKEKNKKDHSIEMKDTSKMPRRNERETQADGTIFENKSLSASLEPLMEDESILTIPLPKPLFATARENLSVVDTELAAKLEIVCGSRSAGYTPSEVTSSSKVSHHLDSIFHPHLFRSQR